MILFSILLFCFLSESQMSVTLSSKNLMFSISSGKRNDPEKIPPSLVIVEDDWNDEIMRRIVK